MTHNWTYIKGYAFDTAESVLSERSLDRLMRYRLSSQYCSAGLIFVHIPRNGGTSIIKALYTKGLAHRTAPEIYRALGPHVWNSLPSFAVIRDPIARIRSAYQYAVQGGTTEGALLRRHRYISAPFHNFDTFVLDWLTKVDLRTVDRLFWPQHWFTGIAPQPSVTRLWRYGDFNALASWLTAATGQAVTIPWLNATSPSYSPGGDVSKQAAKALEKLYGADFELFLSIH